MNTRIWIVIVSAGLLAGAVWAGRAGRPLDRHARAACGAAAETHPARGQAREVLRLAEGRPVQAEAQGDPWVPCDMGLSVEERARLVELLAVVDLEPASRLVQGLLDRLDLPDGREAHIAACQLALSLANDARGLTEVERAMVALAGRPDAARALLLVVGGAGTEECRDWLLRRLSDRTLPQHEADLLDALNQHVIAERTTLASELRQAMESREEPWPGGYEGNGCVSKDPLVVRAVAKCLLTPVSNEVEQRAADLIRSAAVDEATRGEVTRAFLRILRESFDAALRADAMSWLGRMRQPEVASALWEAYLREDPASPERLRLAAAVAAQAETHADAVRVLQAACGEADAEVRGAMLRGLKAYVRANEGDRASLAEAASGMGAGVEEVRVLLAMRAPR